MNLEHAGKPVTVVVNIDIAMRFSEPNLVILKAMLFKPIQCYFTLSGNDSAHAVIARLHVASGCDYDFVARFTKGSDFLN